MIHTDKTKKAQDKLINLTKKEISIISTQEFATRFNVPLVKDFLGVYYYFDNKHIIAVNYNKPETIESSFVHECCHAIMKHEKYSEFEYKYFETDTLEFINTLKFITSILTSAIQHPKVYRMMEEDFNIDMNIYFEGIIFQKNERLEKQPTISNQNLDHKIFLIQQNIIDGLEYLYYPLKYKNDILKKLMTICPNSYDYLKGLEKAKLDFMTLKSHKKSSQDFLDKIKKYGVKKTESQNLNVIWDRINLV
jgi:hypothetical protein